MDRKPVGVLADKVFGGKGYKIEWSTEYLVPLDEEWTEHFVQTPTFKLWGFNVRLKIDITQKLRQPQYVTMRIRLSPLNPDVRAEEWSKLCKGTESYLTANCDFRLTFDTRKGEGDVNILTTSSNEKVFQLNFKLPLNKQTGMPQMWDFFQLKLVIEKPEKEYSLEADKASLDCLQGIRHLSGELGRLLANPEGSDLMFRCRNQEFPVHKFILSARSTTLKKMLGKLQEGTLEKVKGPLINPKAFKLVLEWIYTGVMKDKGRHLADISALARYWGLEKLEHYSNKLADTNYRLKLPEYDGVSSSDSSDLSESSSEDGESGPSPNKKSKINKKHYYLVFGDMDLIPWKSRRYEWKVELPKLVDENKELRSPSVKFYGIDWSLVMKVNYQQSYPRDFKAIFQISLEPEPSALRELGLDVGAKPILKFHIKYSDDEYHRIHNNESAYSDYSDYSDYSGSDEDDCGCGECYSNNRYYIKRIGVNQYKLTEKCSLMNRLYEKKHEIQIDWTLQIEFKSGLLADKMQREINKEKEFLKGLALDLGNLLDDPGESDVVLRCEGKEFRAHKVILAAQSPVFKAMLDIPMKESLESVVEVRDVHGELVGRDVVGATLRWMYTGELGALDVGQTLITLGLAEFYNLNKLKELCEIELKGLIKKESVVDILIMADFVRAVDLKMEAIQFIHKNKSITETEDFKRVSWDLLKDLYMDR